MSKCFHKQWSASYTRSGGMMHNLRLCAFLHACVCVCVCVCVVSIVCHLLSKWHPIYTQVENTALFTYSTNHIPESLQYMLSCFLYTQWVTCKTWNGMECGMECIMISFKNEIILALKKILYRRTSPRSFAAKLPS